MSSLSGRLQLDDIIALLAPTLGQEAATAVVSSAARSLSMTGPYLSLNDSLQVLDTVALKGGVVGAACRFAKQRIQSSASRSTTIPPSSRSGPTYAEARAAAKNASAPASSPTHVPASTAAVPPVATPSASAQSVSGSTGATTSRAEPEVGDLPVPVVYVSRDDIAAIFTSALGEEKARELVARVAEKQRFGLRGSVNQALSILEALALEPGIVGVTARFGKARLILRR